MQERDPQPMKLDADRERDVGLRGDRLVRAELFLGLVFVVGVGIVAWIALSARRRRQKGP